MPAFFSSASEEARTGLLRLEKLSRKACLAFHAAAPMALPEQHYPVPTHRARHFAPRDVQPALFIHFAGESGQHHQCLINTPVLRNLQGVPGRHLVLWGEL
jgi:hypothetical protein